MDRGALELRLRPTRAGWHADFFNAGWRDDFADIPPEYRLAVARHIAIRDRQQSLLLLAGRAPEKYRRVHALTLGELASTLDSRGQMDEAVSTWGEALDLMDGITSKRNTESIQSMRNTMRRYQARGVPGAAALSERARKALAA
ncbi:hypothetical protein [Kitasatospora sp. NPDC005856]|uniref:hypothetical protein n=1 Tax=Kitasatospora sp. NPDC005856 TaxID=3154566 RepID=UPI0033F4CF1B